VGQISTQIYGVSGAVLNANQQCYIRQSVSSSALPVDNMIMLILY